MSGAQKKCPPISLRLDPHDHEKLAERAGDLGVSPGVLARNLLCQSLHSESERCLESLKDDVHRMQTELAVLHADLRQLNANLCEALKAILCGQTGDETLARDMAEELIQPLGDD